MALILIVDDESKMRHILKIMLSLEGHNVEGAQDGETALAMVRERPYDLVISDIQMPGMDGFEVARKLKDEPCGTDMKIILLTSVGQKGDTARCKELGISGYLLKPVEQSELLDVISISLGHTPGEKMPVVTRYTIQEARRRLKNPLKVKK